MSKTQTLAKKVGQLFVVGVPGTSLDRAKLDFLGRLGIGGVVHFSANYESLQQIVELNNSIQKTICAESFEQIPAWICVDHEGGRVQRFRKPFTEWPPQAEWGAINSAKTCFEVGFIMAKELLSIGVNCNFAPVIDVLQSSSKAIGDRAYSANPEQVGALGSATLRGLMKGGIFAVAKHFPGHGAVEVDSHHDLPVCNKTLEELDKCDWVPFRKVFRARAEGVMTAHILFPKLDPDRPATLSRRILQEQVRKNLRFSKLIFSDDLEMGAIQKKYSLKDAAFLAVEAGCDQILLCHEWNQIEEIHSYLVNAFESGALPMKRLDESLERIMASKKRFLLPFKYADVELAKAIVGAPDFLAVAQSIREGKAVEDGPSNKELGDQSEKEA